MSPISQTATSSVSPMLQAVGYPTPDLHHMTCLGGGTAPPAPCEWAANGRHHILLAVAPDLHKMTTCKWAASGRHHILLAVAAAAAAVAAAAAADVATVNVDVLCLAAVTDGLTKAVNRPTPGREGSHSKPPLHRGWR